jgi:site-specific DNA-methyltransferase (adenine-specific)
MITDGNNYCLYNEECLKAMSYLPEGCVDMVLCDLPYGTTACKWDTIIPFEPLWAAYRRVCKKNAAIVLTASQPFTSALVMSNPKEFKYDWCWEKPSASGHLNAKLRPLRAHESILVFCHTTPPYYFWKTTGHTRKVALNVDRSNKLSECYGEQKSITNYDSTERYPRSVVKFSTDKQKTALHPTQKPVALMEYLIRTYTNEGETVLDNTMGSGTTGVACMNTGRRFIGMEKDTEHGYFEIAVKRIQEACAL